MIQEKALPLHPQLKEQGCSEWQLTLGYGVMVTLQILVLSFLVRVRVPQQKKSQLSENKGSWDCSLKKISLDYRYNIWISTFGKKLGLQLLSQQLQPAR